MRNAGSYRKRNPSFPKSSTVRLKDGPQVVTRRNKESVVILQEDEYRKLKTKRAKQTPSIIETILAMPRVAGFKIPERDKNDLVPLNPPLFN